ncbi:carbohydrate ABC transporter substrate-binding protein [Clostridium sp. P21]|uniref:Carbohydrate ABC transporter substrate-binding protein n=1 Tax=Clostridium muellerianum TaxID=2716538 RepID=A0A7Y0EEF5_9CLOT|nr:ABC transporter substrate-binding protein [Clostridium muellerianum]NMM61587.1 carbohydrate ABC transporter substrate-binding protein [Clostridium muellerianum]
MKKGIKVLTMAVLLTMITSAISCKRNNYVSKNTDELQGKVTILTDKNHEQSLKMAVQSFQKLHKKVNIDLKVDDNSYGKFEESVKNKDKTIDIITIDDSYTQYYLNKLPGAFLDVSDDMGNYKNKVSKGKVGNLTQKSKVYGFPWSTSPKVILYRKDILDSEGINMNDTKTWDDYIEVGKKVIQDKGKKVIGNVENENSDIYLLLANQLGKSYFNEEGKPSFNDKEWISVVDMVKKMYSQGTVCDYNTKEELINAAKSEEIVSFIASPSDISYFVNNVPDQKGKWSVMKLPSFEPGGNRDTSLGGCNLMISKMSTNVKLSKEFINFTISDKEVDLDSMLKCGSFPVVNDIYNLEKFNKFEDYFNATVWDLLGNVENGAYAVTYTPYFFNIRYDVKNALAQPNLVNKDTKTVLDSIQKYVEKK